MLHLDYRDSRPIYTQIVDGLRKQILAGVLAEGDKLPSVRELAAQLTINPNTIQRAYRELEMGGWIATVPGKGCFVTGTFGADWHAQQALLRQFDDLCDRLRELGITDEELLARLTKGGNDHA